MSKLRSTDNAFGDSPVPVQPCKCGHQWLSGLLPEFVCCHGGGEYVVVCPRCKASGELKATPLWAVESWNCERLASPTTRADEDAEWLRLFARGESSDGGRERLERIANRLSNEERLRPTVTDAMREAGKAAWVRCIDSVSADNTHPDAFGEVFRAMLLASSPAEHDEVTEAMIEAGLANLRDRRLLKWLFCEHPDDSAAIGYVDRPLDLDVQREVVTAIYKAMRAAMSQRNTSGQGE